MLYKCIGKIDIISKRDKHFKSKPRVIIYANDIKNDKFILNYGDQSYLVSKKKITLWNKFRGITNELKDRI